MKFTGQIRIELGRPSRMARAFFYLKYSANDPYFLLVRGYLRFSFSLAVLTCISLVIATYFTEKANKCDQTTIEMNKFDEKMSAVEGNEFFFGLFLI